MRNASDCSSWSVKQKPKPFHPTSTALFLWQKSSHHGMIENALTLAQGILLFPVSILYCSCLVLQRSWEMASFMAVLWCRRGCLWDWVSRHTGSPSHPQNNLESPNSALRKLISKLCFSHTAKQENQMRMKLLVVWGHISSLTGCISITCVVL